MGVYIFPKVRKIYFFFSISHQGKTHMFGFTILLLKLIASPNTITFMLCLVALRLYKCPLFFCLQSHSDPSELLFDAGNWNSVAGPQTTELILGACILPN